MILILMFYCYFYHSLTGTLPNVTINYNIQPLQLQHQLILILNSLSFYHSLTGTLSSVLIMSVVPSTTDARIVLNNIPLDIGRVIVGYERHDLGVILQGEYTGIFRRTQHTFSSLVPGARYTAVVQGLTAAVGDRSQQVTRVDFKTIETGVGYN